MVEILTEKQRSDAVRRLRFCYLCGKPLAKSWSRDHVPPRSYVSGRGAALPMRTHPECNEAWSVRDERAGQLISTMIGRYPSSPEKTRIDTTRFTNLATGESFFGVLDFGMEQDVRRIVRAFHAALYDEHLADEGIHVSLPFATGHAPSGVPEPEPPPPWHQEVVIDLLRSKHFTRLDRLVCDGGECEYICTWMPSTQVAFQCAFGIRLHTWGDFGDLAFTQRGCVGFYYRERRPAGAAEAPTITLRIRIPNPLNPFAE